jgi:hypothetical protein
MLKLGCPMLFTSWLVLHLVVNHEIHDIVGVAWNGYNCECYIWEVNIMANNA